MTRRRSLRLLTTAAALPLTALLAAGCGGGSPATASTAPPTTPDGHTATIGVADNGGLGKILVDSQGRTLYLFQGDSGTKSTCMGECAKDWPPARVSGKPTAGKSLTASKLGSSARSDGGRQITYNGHPLYRFEGDHNPGDAGGQGMNAFGAQWYVLSPAGTFVAGSAPSTSSSGGGGGY
jgi:predicted lipoprotein with Yx(FWY)xxD motif